MVQLHRKWEGFFQIALGLYTNEFPKCEEEEEDEEEEEEERKKENILAIWRLSGSVLSRCFLVPLGDHVFTL